MKAYFKPSIVKLKPYSSARDESEGLDGLFLDANENSFNFDYRRYPDPYQNELKRAIGEWRNIDPSNIFLGNGSDEIIDILIRSTCHPNRDRILALNPSYGMYKVSADINDIPLDLVALNPDFSLNVESFLNKLEDNHKLIFLCSPNNPNGGLLDTNTVETILDRSKGLVVMDEAYIDLSDSSSWLN